MVKSNHDNICTAQTGQKDDVSSVKLLESLSFAKQVQIIADTSQYSKIKDTLYHPISFRVTTTLKQFLNLQLFDTYIDTKLLIAYSVSSLDYEDCFAVKEGCLYLSLTTDSYQKCGLVGKKSKVNDGKYLIRLSMVRNDLDEESRLGKAFKECLTEPFIIKFSISWIPNISIKKLKLHLAELLETEDLEWITKMTERTSHGTILPLFDIPDVSSESGEVSANYKQEIIQEWASNLYEWIGMVSIDSSLVKLNGGIDHYLSQYQVFDSEVTTDLIIFNIIGVFSGSFLAKFWENLAVATHGPLVFQVYGSENCIIGFDNRERGRGEIGCSVISLKNDEYMTFKLTTKHERPEPKKIYGSPFDESPYDERSYDESPYDSD